MKALYHEKSKGHVNHSSYDRKRVKREAKGRRQCPQASLVTPEIEYSNGMVRFKIVHRSSFSSSTLP
jgi:hypothetical protein